MKMAYEKMEKADLAEIEREAARKEESSKPGYGTREYGDRERGGFSNLDEGTLEFRSTARPPRAPAQEQKPERERVEVNLDRSQFKSNVKETEEAKGIKFQGKPRFSNAKGFQSKLGEKEPSNANANPGFKVTPNPPTQTNTESKQVNFRKK